MRCFLLACSLMLLSSSACAADETAIDHDRLMTLDTHVDLPRYWATPRLDPGRETPHQADLVKMKAGGLDAAFFIAYAEQRERTPEGLDQARRDALGKIFAIHRMVDQYPDLVAFAYTADDVERIAASGRIAALIGLENGFPVGEDLDWVRLMHEAGVRYITLTHNGHNQIGDSTNPKEEFGDEETLHGGLSDFGRDVVAEMNRLGIVVDVSHTAESTTIEAARLSEAPVMASHSSVKALADVTRNLSDAGLRAIAESGGVVQIVALDAFVAKKPEEWSEKREALYEKYEIDDRYLDVARLPDEERRAFEAEWRALGEEFGVADVSAYVDHIDYAVKLIGIDHVAISSDFGGGGGVDGWWDATETPNVTAELARRGYSKEDIAKIWSGNTLRVLHEVERVAARLQREGGE